MSEEVTPGASGDTGSAPESTIQEPGRHAFRVGALNLLVPQGTLCEVMDLPVLARVPNTAPWLAGLANLRGGVVPVFDLAHACGLGATGGARAKLLVIDEGEAAAGVMIDGLPVLARFTPEERVACPQELPAHLRDCATDCFARDGDRWIEFAHKRLFGALAEEVAIR